jgi:4-amino-4-deoxychorismate lyase
MIVNGHEQLNIPIADRAVQYGDGCFTTMAYRAGKLELFDAHIERLRLACKALFIQYDDWSGLKQSIIDSFSQTKDCKCVVKVIITRGEGGRGYSPENVSSPNVIITQHQIPDHYHQWQSNGISLTRSAVKLARQPLLAGIKHLNRLEQILVKQDLHSSGFDDAIVCDTELNIIETSVGNLFWYKNNRWFTSSLEYSGVEGVMRNLLLSLMTEKGLSCDVVQGSFDDLLESQEILVCNSLMTIIPVSSLFCPKTKQTRQYQNQNTLRLQKLMFEVLDKGATEV